MPLPSDSYSGLDNTINRLAGESILAQAGRDEGLVPSYSLLGDLAELCSTDTSLRQPVLMVQGRLEQLLDGARPFDDATLGLLRAFVEWLPVAVETVKADGVPAAFGGAGAAGPAAAALPTATTGGGEASEEVLRLSLDDNRDLLVEFHAETVDHLQQIEAALLALDHQPDHPESLHAIFRSFHTIKGNAGFLGLVPMHTLAHEVESLLDLARNHQLRLTAAIITEILRSRDALQQLTQQVGQALEKGMLPSEVVPVRHLIAAVKRLARADSAEPVEPVPALPPPMVSSPASVVVSAPSPVPSASVAPTAPDAEAVAKPRIDALPASATSAIAPKAPAAAPAPASATVRVNTEKLDSLMDVVGELVIVQSQLIESSRASTEGNTALQRNVAQLSRITKDLQSTAMSLRMIPIKPIFQKMERLARDLARDFGKKVAFVTSGEDTELDRTVVEEIGDPLVHMVRNALDHGLEDPEARLRSGKQDTGSLHLRAYHQGSNIVIELSDDGKGIDPERVYRKAVEKGVIAAGTTLSREETFALILAPGFSTAEKVTSVSGRGVGMDVVKRNIEKMRGKLEIASEVGRGSTFKIKLPLTMAIIDGLVVRVGTDRFILPSTSVQMALRPTAKHISTVHGQGEVLELRGKFIPIHRLHRRFSIDADARHPWEGIVVLVEHSGRTSGLLVDEMVSKQEVVIKNLGAFMQNLPGVSGGAILGDGNIALILDPGTLLSAA